MANDSLRISDFSAYIKTGREFYASRPPPPGRWRKRSRAVICDVIAANPDADTAALLTLVDAAYPFGEREHHPYKAWLAERKLLIGDLDPAPKSAEEWGVVLVAIDMEEEGRGADAIRALLDEQAQNRHSRPCPTCAARKGDPCREAEVVTFALHTPFDDALQHSYKDTKYVDRLIPHAARCQP